MSLPLKDARTFEKDIVAEGLLPFINTHKFRSLSVISARKKLTLDYYISKLRAIMARVAIITFNLLIYNGKHIAKRAGANVRFMKICGHIWLMVIYDHDT